MRDRRRSVAGFADGAGGGLAAGAVLLLSDGLSGLVGVPGVVVGYMALGGVLVAMALAPVGVRLGRRADVIAPAVGVLLLIGAAVPAVPVFASAVMAAGFLAGALVLRPRGPAVWAGGVAGLAAAAADAAWAGTPVRLGLAAAGGGVLLLGLAAGASGGERVRLRDEARGVRPALPAYAVTGVAGGLAVLPVLHLLEFRWQVLNGDAMRWTLAACAGAAVVTLALGAFAETATVPMALAVSAGGLVLATTAPGPAYLAVGMGIAVAGTALAGTGLDRAWAAPFSGLVAAAGGLGGLGPAALLGRVAPAGTALTVAAALLACASVWVTLTLPRPGWREWPVEARRVSDRRGRIRRVTFGLAPGEIVEVRGEHADRFCALLSGEEPVGGGLLLSGGRDVTAMPASRRAELGLCHHLPARPGPGRTVIAHLDAVAPGRADGVLAVFPRLAGHRHHDAADLDDTATLLLGLAAALLARPRLVLLRGPADPALAPVLRTLAEGGSAVVLVSPPPDLADALGCRVFHLKGARR